MKKFLIPILASLILVQNCSDASLNEDEPMTIQRYIESNKDQDQSAMSQFLRKRCAATFLIAADLIPRNSPRQEKIVTQLISAANKFLMSYQSIGDTSSLKTDEVIRMKNHEDVKIIFTELKEAIDKKFLETGVLVEFLQEDLVFCEIAAKARFKK